jgi:hypothetical protein
VIPAISRSSMELKLERDGANFGAPGLNFTFLKVPYNRCGAGDCLRCSIRKVPVNGEGAAH